MEDKCMTASEDFCQDFGDTQDVLSLCNLPIHGDEYEETSLHSSRGSVSSDPDLFEFFGCLASEISRNNSVVSRGNIIDQDDGGEVNEYRKRDYLCLKSASFQKAIDLNDEDREYRSVSRNRSSSLRFSISEVFQPKRCSPAQKVNITAITSMSAKSRRRMFMFGPVKFKPEMDVVAIKKRQSRRPMQIPPVPEGGEMVTAGGGGGGRRGKSGGDGGLLRPLWCRSHLATVLAKSFGCISASMV